MVSKKGLSDVVSNVLIILIVVAAVAILGLIVVNMVRNTDVSTASFTCTQLQIEPTVCNYNAANLATYVIQRKDSLSDITVKSVTYSLSRAVAADSETITTTTGLIPIQTLSSTSAKTSVPTSLEVVSAIILDENGEDYVCAINKKLDCTRPMKTLAVTKTGVGTVTSAGINCGTDCTEDYDLNQNVVLSTSGGTLLSWSGDGINCPGTSSCTVTMDAAKTVIAQFSNAPVSYSLTVQKSGGNHGTITGTSNPAQTNINCGSTCSRSYTSGTIVTLNVQAVQLGYTFTGWSGAGCSGTGSCVVTMSAARTVIATFAQDSTNTEQS
jgi:hypothetical protein